MEILRVSRVIHDCHLDGCALLLCVEVDDVVEEVGTTAVDVADEVLQTAFAMELLSFCFALFIGSQVGQRDGDACIQVSQFAHTIGEDVIFICSGCEDCLVGPELLTCASQFRCADSFDSSHGFADGVFLLIDLAITVNLADHLGRKGVHTADTHTMQTAADFVAAFVELTASMQNSHDHLESALVFLFVHVDRNASTVVLNGDAVVLVDCHFDVCAIACQRFVDRVVDGFVHEMVQSLLADVADIHGRTLTYGFQSFQHLNI